MFLKKCILTDLKRQHFDNNLIFNLTEVNKIHALYVYFTYLCNKMNFKCQCEKIYPLNLANVTSKLPVGLNRKSREAY